MNINSNDSFEFSDQYISNALDMLEHDLASLDAERQHLKRAIRSLRHHIKQQKQQTSALEEQWAMPATGEAA